MRNYWIITQLFYPDETSTGYVMTKIAETLKDVGIVNVFCGTTDYQSKSLSSSSKLSSHINIFRVKTPNVDKNRLLHRIYLFLYFTVAVFFKILFKVRKRDSVILVTNPPTLLLVVRFLKFFKKFELVIILQDIFPENAVASGIMKINSLSYKIILKSINYGYDGADKLIACGNDMASLFINKGIDASKIKVIPNWADHELVTPDYMVDRNKYFDMELSGKIVIEFAGNIGRVQGLDHFVRIFKKSTNTKLVLIILGDGANKKALKDFVQENEINNVFFFKSKPRNEQQLFLNSCNIGLVTLCEGMYGLGVPSKVYNIMSAGRPILYIGDTGSEVDSYISNNNVGWSFNWKDEDKILKLLDNLPNEADIFQIGLNARKFVLNNFTQELVLKKYKDFFTINQLT